MAAKGGDGMPGALKYQTWTLKVPIHCEGCSRKVKRVLHSIDGVFTISVDSQQHKVEVTGDVDSETLIKKLTKSGKQAELWPDQKEKKSSGKSKNKDNKQEKPKDSDDAGEEASKDANGVESEDDDGDDDGENDASENKETGGANKEAGAAGTGGKKKKKKKKGKKKNDGDTGDGAATGNTPGTSSGFAPPITGSVSMNPFPSIYYTPQIHGTSYNAAYPSPSTSYYYGATPTHAYSYSHPGSAYALPPPSDPIKTYVDDDHDYDDHDGGCSIV
ncbi:heavy metal-associated isoprenylated plant protein 36-like [Rhodamnia argentea]|uniref:Heavy metal-associated isoprenylated plant protein 36-like n=1 Tax=Rhodamnia argentea TaxID=178133 RepID=A0A8B8PCZ9_9MYRT|nr:heavy metal-associated isoprenylated plant protein 36-like [Rhodamnia argentea]